MTTTQVSSVGRAPREREIADLNPGRTANQGLKITGKIILAVLYVLSQFG